MEYLLDSNIFIQAKNLHYGFDFCPAFWDWLVMKNDEGTVCSVEKVKDELDGFGDELSEWIKDKPGLFLPLTPDIFPSLERVSSWAQSQTFEQMAINEFFQAADYYLVSQALTLGYTVVSHEIVSNSLKRIKIPNVCIGLGIKFMTPFEMLRRERARFVLND
jgi:hypothetical protein